MSLESVTANAPISSTAEPSTRPELRHGRPSMGALHKRSVPGAGLQADLRLALADPAESFVMHYQPVVDLTSGKVVAVEALMRWQHPVLGLLGPNRFIALAEDCGLIRQLGDWALGRVVEDAVVLIRQGRELDMAINFSAHQLDDEIVAKVHGALESSGLGPGRLTIEVTESAFLDDEGITAATCEALSRLSVKFAIDDCGTSFSSLLRLRQYPINALKIDGALIAGIGKCADDEATCDSIISLARAVGASTVAEGVETTEQYAVLRSMECERGQGWLWSPAVPMDELGAAIAACEGVPMAERQPRMPQVADAVSDAPAHLILTMHAEGSSTHDIAAALNRSAGRHPSGVRWTAGAVARRLPAAPLTS